MELLDTFISERVNLEAKRGLCVRMYNQGIASSSICEILQISQQYVSKWTRKYKELGLSSLHSKYKGKPSFLSKEEQREIIDFLLEKESYSLVELQIYIEEKYLVIFKSKQSYYDLLSLGGLSWHKTQKSNPRKDEVLVLEKREEIKKNWIQKEKQLKKKS
jgi:putative transposase